MDSDPILSLAGVSFAYPGRPALFEGLDFALRADGRIGLYGPNGCGKTTLLRLIMGLEAPTAGTILRHGRPARGRRALAELRRNVGYVMQNSDDQLFSLTVLEEVAFGPLNLGLKRAAARERAMETLESLGLGPLAERATQRLSGGEKKMVALAAVLSMRPEALLLDEPTVSLDEEATARLTDILGRQSLARIIVSHDRDFLARTATTRARLCRSGVVHEDQ